MNFDSYKITENVLFIMGQHVTSTHQQISWQKIDYFQSKSVLSISKTSSSQPSNTTPKYFLLFHLEMQSSWLNVEFVPKDPMTGLGFSLLRWEDLLSI